MDEQQKRYILEVLTDLEYRMRLVGVELIEAGHEELARHGNELIDAASVVETWIHGWGSTMPMSKRMTVRSD